MSLSSEVRIGNRRVGSAHNPYIVAEIGSNFDQSLDRARSLIAEAAKAGADAAKFQLFDPDSLYPPGHEYNKLFHSIRLRPDWIPALIQAAHDHGVAFLASAFDRISIGILEDNKVPAHKAASSEVSNHDIIAAMAQSGKPILMSTGMCSVADVAEAVELCRGIGNRDIVLLQCTAEYPLAPARADLRAMGLLADAFGGIAGFSDHTESETAGAAAVGNGAVLLEKHVTHDRKAKGPDHSFALEMDAFGRYVAAAREAHVMLGERKKTPTSAERAQGRRQGIYATDAIAAGAMLDGATEARRPATGVPARFARLIAKARARRSIARDEAVKWEDLEW